MYWQDKGDYLCVAADRYTKSKKVNEKKNLIKLQTVGSGRFSLA
jgi:uncharacterized protein with WD repeat